MAELVEVLSAEQVSDSNPAGIMEPVVLPPPALSSDSDDEGEGEKEPPAKRARLSGPESSDAKAAPLQPPEGLKKAPAAEEVEQKQAETESQLSLAAPSSEALQIAHLEGADRPWAESFEAQQLLALVEHGREALVDEIFHAWDRDGIGHLTFEQLLPYYMKSAFHHDQMEPEVRSGFISFMLSQGKKPSEGITLELFRRWLSRLSDEQVAAHYVRHVQGWADAPYRMNLGGAVVKDYQHRPLKEILDAPVHALRGLSIVADDALAPLGLHKVRDLANWKPFLVARALCQLAVKEVAEPVAQGDTHVGVGASKHHANIRNALTKEHEAATLKQVLDLPVSALSMFPEQGDAVLEKINIKTIRQLGKRRYFHWANAILELEHFEA